jgi:hypothetical protein
MGILMERCELYGYITEMGVLHIQNRKRLEEWAQQYPGKQVMIKIERRGSKRSSPQNRYYHGVVVQEVKLGLLNIGYEMTAEETHFFLKSKFNPVQIPNKEGEAIELPGTTTNLTKTQFGEYIEKIAMWAVEYLRIRIPQPNEHLEMKFE